jgi:hypothetical protein
MTGATHDLRAARANHVFRTDKKRIRTENAVMDKTKDGLGLLFCTRSQLRNNRQVRS